MCRSMITKEYLVKRLLISIATLAFVIILTFFLFRVMPGDPISILFHDPRVTPESKERMRIEFGLDKSLFDQFISFIIQLFRGNLGYSFAYQQPVSDVVMQALINTLIFAIPFVVLSTIAGVLVGIASSWWYKKKVDVLATSVSVLFWSMPVYWEGIVMILLFAVYIPIFPTSGMHSYGGNQTNIFGSLFDLLYHLALPLIAMVLGFMGQFALIMRSSMVDVLTEDYMLTANAKGLSTRQIIFKHALRNSLLPTITLLSMNLGFIVAGQIQIETVFAWPGIGRLIYSSITTRDYPVLQGTFLLTAVSVILLSLIADVIYTYLDPRIKY